MKRTLCALALLLVTASGSRAAAAILYAATGSNGVPGILYTVDPATGTATVVGSTVITDPANCPVTAPCAIGLTGLAFHPSTGILYGFTSNSAQGTTNLHSLVTIDPTSGVATLISTNAIGDDPLGDIAFAADGTLYGWQAGTTTSDSLVQINLTDGTQTQIGLSGLGGTSGNGLSFVNGTLFLSANGAGADPTALKPTTGELRTVDPVTGDTTVVGILTGAPNAPAIAALAVDASGTLFGVDTNSGANTTCNLVTINTATGSVTDHGALPANTDALAFATADLSITKSHTANFFQGQTGATYSITVTNVGSAPSSGLVTVTDAVPSGLTATGIAGGLAWSCTQPSGPCTRSDALPVGLGYAPLTLTVNVANNAPSSVTNSATVSGGGEVNAANDTANDVTTIAVGPDTAITKTHTGNFTQGQIGATYTITVSNAGATPTSGLVTVTDAVPTGLTAIGIVGTGWVCTAPSGPCTRSDALAGGASYPALTLTVNVAGNAPSSVTNSATVSGGGDVNAANDTANDLTGIITGAATDLTITKTHVGNFAQGQTGATYTITVSNVGGTPTDGSTVTVTDAVPTGLTATGIVGSAPWSCTQPSGPCTRSDVLGSLASYPALTLTVNVATDAPTLVTNSATVAGGGDASTANDTATDPTTITHATQFFTLVPCRVMDTRNPNGLRGGPAFAPGETRIFAVAGTCSIPAGAVVIVSVNLTVTNQTMEGFLKVYAGDTSAPPTSVLNFRPGKTRANNAIVALSSDGLGTIAIKNSSTASADVILDVNGYFQ